MLMSKKLGIPFTFEAHAVDIFVKPCLKALEKRMREASATTTISYYNRDYLHKLTNINIKKIHVVRACPVIDKFKCVKRNPEVLSILTVGRLVEKKGIKYGILAIKELIKDYPEIQYSIVGSGLLETELKSLARLVDLQNNVRFLGNLDDNSLIDELRKATIFILPCVIAKNEDRDGIPVSLMESMYLRIPTVSTNISGISELIEDRREGFLVEPGNFEQLASAIKTLLENENLRITMGVNGRKKIVTQFNIHKEARKLLEIWETNRK